MHAHIHTQTHTAKPRRALAVTRETWAGTEAPDKEEATFGGLSRTERKVTIHDLRGRAAHNAPTRADRRPRTQAQSPSSHPGRSRPQESAIIS